MQETKTVAVVIPTLNAGQQLPTILDSVKRQGLQPLEVFVLDSESEDDTRAIGQRYGASVMSIARRDFDHGGTRNVGLNATRADIAVYTVQDAVPSDDNWLTNLCRPIMTDAKVGVVTGRQIPRVDATELEKATRLLTYPVEGYRRDVTDLERIGLRAAFCTDTNAAYRVSALRQVGGFPAPCIVHEDMAAAVRLMRGGYVLVYEPRAAIVHSHSYGLREQFQRYFDMGVFFAGDELRGMGRPTRNAIWYMRRHLIAIVNQGGPRLLGPWFIDTLARAIGVFVGGNYKMIPARLRRYLSRQKSYWSRLS